MTAMTTTSQSSAAGRLDCTGSAWLRRLVELLLIAAIAAAVLPRYADYLKLKAAVVSQSLARATGDSEVDSPRSTGSVASEQASLSQWTPASRSVTRTQPAARIVALATDESTTRPL